MAVGSGHLDGFIFNGVSWPWWDVGGNWWFSDLNFPQTFGAGNAFQDRYVLDNVPSTERVFQVTFQYQNGDLIAGMDIQLATPLRTLLSFSLGGCGRNDYQGPNHCPRETTWTARNRQEYLTPAEAADLRWYVYSRGGQSFITRSMSTTWYSTVIPRGSQIIN